MAIGRIVGALADSAGNALGHVDEELTLPVGTVASTCNQLRMDLAATDAEVLQTPCTSTAKWPDSIRARVRRRRRSTCSARPANCFANRRPMRWRAR